MGLRVLLYGHDSYGLGHLSRNLTLAGALVEHLPGASALIVTGNPCATHFQPPPGVDLVKLPSITKDDSGGYAVRGLSEGLGFVSHVRRRLLLESYRAFEPHLVLVDHQVLGLAGEATELLLEARKDGVPAALGLRDVIDSPEAVAREWDSDAIRWALTEGYSRVFVYGVPEVFDPRVEYALPDAISDRFEFTGYVVRPRPDAPATVRGAEHVPEVLVTVGGGEDGAERITRWLDAVALGPTSWKTTIVLGPLFEPREARAVKRRAQQLGEVDVHRFHADLPGRLARCDLVVAMAGYNTSAEILQSGVPSLLLPRTWPRREQQIRAERLEALGLARSLGRCTPRELRAAAEQALRAGPILGATPSLLGRERLCAGVARLLGVPLRKADAPVSEREVNRERSAHRLPTEEVPATLGDLHPPRAAGPRRGGRAAAHPVPAGT